MLPTCSGPSAQSVTCMVLHRELGENMTDEELQEMIDEAGKHVLVHRFLPQDSARLTAGDKAGLQIHK